MGEVIYSFSIDTIAATKYPEQAYIVDMVDGQQMMLMVGLPKMGAYRSFGYEDPKNVLKNIYTDGRNLCRIDKNYRYRNHDIYYGAMTRKWKNEDYIYYRVSADLAEKESRKIVGFAIEPDFTPYRTQYSFKKMEDVLALSDECSMFSRQIENFRRFDNLTKKHNSLNMRNCFGRVIQENMGHRDNSDIRYYVDPDAISPAQRISYSMGYYLRMGVRSFARDNDNIPMLVKKFGDKDFEYSTEKQCRDADPRTDRCTPFTDLLREPATFINRNQIEHFIRNKKLLYSEEQLQESAEFLNNIKELIYIRTSRSSMPKPWFEEKNTARLQKQL